MDKIFYQFGVGKSRVVKYVKYNKQHTVQTAVLLMDTKWSNVISGCFSRTSHRVILGEHDRASSTEDVQVMRVEKVQ